MHAKRHAFAHVTVLAALLFAGCYESSGRKEITVAESCMGCHNGSQHNDYSGPGIENPHPFQNADNLLCTQCHGGNPGGTDKDTSHVPPPPQIGDREQQRTDQRAYFNKLTLAGIDKFPDYTVDGTTYTSLQFLQFINPGDLRVTSLQRGCGQCHRAHGEMVASSPLATSMGIFSSAAYVSGVENHVPENVGLYDNTASDLSFRAVTDPQFVYDPTKIGPLGRLIEQPVYSVFGRRGPNNIFDNPAYDSVNLPNSLAPNNQVISGSPLSHLFQEQIAFTCGDCHLGSAGANNRYADFRSSGCTACHMPYSLDGKSRSRDPNVPKNEPVDPDDIDEPERPHVRSHQIRGVARTLASGHAVQGIDDHTCVGCHQGSNRTVLQYWGIRLDQNQDLRNRVQYPANPVTFRNTAQDTRLFDPAVGNRTFNGRNPNQYILHEDYDGDGRDDTPPDIHHERGLGCVDCHGSFDLHGGNVNDPNGNRIMSRMEHAIAIRCTDCHGTVDAYATTVAGTTYGGVAADLATDSKGNPLRHVVRESDGSYWLTSRLDGRRHYLPQTRDVVVNNGRTNPNTGQPVYSAKASYAMGRVDSDPNNGTGPQQQRGTLNGFAHSDSMECASCHSSWTNTCQGCHLRGEYNTNNFSNITGQRIVYEQANADFTYQSPVYFQLGIAADNQIKTFSANTKAFYGWRDRNGVDSRVFCFTDRNGGGRNPSAPFPSLSHNAFMAHSIRGKVTASDEGPRYCVACHLTDNALANYRPQYDAFRAAMAADNYNVLDWQLLRRHFGQNPGNQLDSPLWVHGVAGLGTGLFLFDSQGAAINPLDNNANRVGSNGVSPAAGFDIARVALNLDKTVNSAGVAQGSSSHTMLAPGALPNRRDGSTDPRMAGPLGQTLVQRLTDPDTGIVLDSWIDADGQLRGNAGNYVR